MSQGGNSRQGSGGGSGTVTDLQGDTGGPVPPTSGIISIAGAQTTYVTGTPITSNLDVEVVSPAHTFLQGTGITTPSSPLGPLTNGQLIIGSSGSPAVANTITAGTNITISNGAGSITINSTAASTVGVDVQVFTTSGTYTPTANMTFASVQVIGGGGGGGGCPVLAVGEISCGSGGGSGGFASGVFDAATIGASQTITIGAGGTAGSGSGFAGNGGNTSFGALMVGNGGNGGQSSVTSNDQSFVGTGATGGTATGGDFQSKGGSGSGSFGYAYLNPSSATRVYAIGGWGGSGQLGQGGGNSITIAGSQTFGENGAGYGSGGSGAACAVDGLLTTGGAGAPGIVIITEYLSTSAGGGSSFTWQIITSNTALLKNNGYITNAATQLSLSLPTVASVGDIVEICGENTGGWILTQASGQSIVIGNQTTSLGILGSLASSMPTDCVRMVCTSANTTFEVLSQQGNPVVS